MMKRNISKIERSLCDCYSEWINHNDTRSDCLRHKLGHVYYSSIIGRFTSCVLAKKNFENYMVFLLMGGNNHAQWPHMAEPSTASRFFVPIVALGVRVVTSPRSDAHAASGDREQDLPDWLQPITEGLVERESGSSGSGGQTFRKTPLPYIPETFEQIWRATWSFNNSAQKSSKVSLSVAH